MMRQFEVLVINGGEHHLTVVNTQRWDFYIGFRQTVTKLPVPIEHTPRFQQLEEDYYNRIF